MRRTRIAVKSDARRMPGLLAAGFDVFEAWLGDQTWLDLAPPAGAEVCAVHQPAVVLKGDARLRANLCDAGEIGERSADTLAKVVAYAARHGAPKVVVHPGYYDAFTEPRDAALGRLAARLDTIRHRDVTVCMENIPRWSNSVFRNESAIARLDDVRAWRRLAPVGTGLVFDVEHFLLAEVVSDVVDGFADAFREPDAATDAALARRLDDAVAAHVAAGWATVAARLGSRLTETVSELAPALDHLHVCGSDLVSFGRRDTRPGIGVYEGEHLPVGYAGLSRDVAVQDRIDHPIWAAALGAHRPPHAVLEVNERPEFDTIKELERSRRLLADVLEAAA